MSEKIKEFVNLVRSIYILVKLLMNLLMKFDREINLVLR